MTTRQTVARPCRVVGASSLGCEKSPYRTVTLTDTTLSGNAAANSGGGIYNDTGSNATLTSVQLNGNSANSSGGIYNTNGTSSLTNVTVSGNTATFNGGAIHNDNRGHAT